MLSVSGRAGAIGALMLVMLIWGSAFVVTKAALVEVPPLLLAFLRFAIASAILLPLAQAQGGLALLPRPLPLGTLTLMGLTGVTLFFVTFNLALIYTSASEAALLTGVTPAATALLAVLTLGERLGRGRAIGIVVSMIGVALIVLAGEGSAAVEPPNRLLGDLLIIASLLSWAVYTILGKRLQQVSGLAITAYGGLIGTALLVPIAAYDLATRPPIGLSAGGWLAVLYLGAGPSALTYVLWNRALRYLDASQAANFINLIPVVGVVSAALFLGETPVLGQLLGGALVLAGVWMVLR